MKSKMMKKLALLLACSAVFATAGLVSCTDNKPNEPVVYTLDISNEPTEELKLSSATYTLTLLGEYPKDQVVWTSSDPTVATVENGVLTLVGEGVVKITASLPDHGVSDEITVEVINDIPVQATGISITNKPTGAVDYGAENLYLEYALSPDGAEDEKVVWTSSQEEIATVDSNGTVRVLSDGQTDIKVALERDRNIFDEFTLTVNPWKGIQVVGDDGSFEDKEGGVSVYTAHTNEVFNGFGWSREVSLIKTGANLPDGEEGKALRVVSKTTTPDGVPHIWSALFIHFDTEITQGKTYNLDYDMKWLGAEDATGFYYSIDKLTDTGMAQMIPQGGYNEIARSELFKKDGRISFVATEDCDGVYLQLVNNADVSFDFTMDNLSLTEDATKPIQYTRYALNETVTLLGNKDSEITDTDSAWSGARASKILKYNDGSLRVVSENAEGTRNAFFVRFDTAIEKGKTYDITLNGEWFGENDPYNLHYSLDVGTAQTQSLLGYTPIAKTDLFKTDAKISFTANGDYEYFYLRMICDENSATEGLDLFDFAITSASVEKQPRTTAWKGDDGTFEGVDGNISLYTVADQAEVGLTFAWANIANLSTVTENGNTSVKVQGTENAHQWDMLYIKFDQKIESGKSYTITFDATWLGDNLEDGVFGYWILAGESCSATVVDYTDAFAEDIFKKSASITFTANGDYDYFYFLLREANEGDPSVIFNFTIDNISVAENA